MPSMPVRAPTLPPWVPRGAARTLLILYAISALGSGFLLGWWPTTGPTIFQKLVCSTEALKHGEVWRFLSAGFVQEPSAFGLLFGLITIYFFTPDLVAQWGPRKLAGVLIGSFAVGYAINAGLDALFSLAPSLSLFRPQSTVFGPAPALTALVAGWARTFPDRPLRFFFVPMIGKHLYWLEIGMCILHTFFREAGTSGNLPLFVGIGVATLVSGQPSLLRQMVLRLRLRGLRRDRDAVEHALRKAGAPARKPGSPDLRVVRGGADDEPKDKRYLN